MVERLRTVVRGLLVGLVIAAAGVGLPVVTLVAGDGSGSTGFSLLGGGVVLLFGGVLWIAVGRVVRRPLGLERARGGTCPFTGEPAVVARYLLVLGVGWFVVGLGLLVATGGMVVAALAPTLAGHPNGNLVLLLGAGLCYKLIGLEQIPRLLTGRIRRGGVWLTPTGLVHRSWDGGMAVRWDDLDAVTVEYGLDMIIVPKDGTAEWVSFPPNTWTEVAGPWRVEGRAVGMRAIAQIAELAERCRTEGSLRHAISIDPDRVLASVRNGRADRAGPHGPKGAL